MSHEAVTWAMDRAPMLRTDSGKPDTTSRGVLHVLAEHASSNGTNTHPSVVRIRFRTGYDRSTVRRALKRLEAAGLIVADGTVKDCQRWKLSMWMERPASDWDELEADEQRQREAGAARVRRHRASKDASTTDG